MPPKPTEEASPLMIRKCSTTESRWPRLCLASPNKNSKMEDAKPELCGSPSTTSTTSTTYASLSPNGKREEDEIDEQWLFQPNALDTSLLDDYPGAKEVRFADFPQDPLSLQGQVEEMQSRYLQEKERRRRKERALVKLAKELAKRPKVDTTKQNGIEDESSLCNEIVRLQLKNKLLEEQLSLHSSQTVKFSMLALVLGVSIGWYFCAQSNGTLASSFC